MNKSGLLKLAERIEASPPSRELNRAVAKQWGWHRVEPRFASNKHGAWIAPGDFLGVESSGRPRLDSLHGTEMHRDVPDFTTSLDAAKTLRHPADLWCVGSMEDGPFARVVPALPGGKYGGEITVHAETAENALTAAFLRATALRSHAAMMTEGEG